MPLDRPDTDLLRLMETTVDPEWYKRRYPDVVAANQDPVQHFIQFGVTENRDPNRFFDSAWYLEHYPDVASSGFNPLLHYLRAGALELRNPHPRFDARYYVQQHPDAGGNPLLYHLRIGLARGYLTEDPIDIRDYLPVENPPALPRSRVLADVVIPICYSSVDTRQCLLSVLADRTHPLGRVTVIDDASAEPSLLAWLRKLAAAGQIHLIRNRRQRGYAACAALGIEASDTDVVLLCSDTEVSPGWLHRLSALAWSHPRIATISALSNNATTADGLDVGGSTPAVGQTQAVTDEICRTVNAGRSVPVQRPLGICTYIRRDALLSVGGFIEENQSKADFCHHTEAAGWQHRLAYDTFVYQKDSSGSGNRGLDLVAPDYPDNATLVAQHTAPRAADPFRFAITAALWRRSALPVILMVTHDYGGGIRRHIESLAERYRGSAHVLLLEGSDRGATLSMPEEARQPVLKLPSDRIDDMILLLRSANVSRIHIHHLLHVDVDMRRLIHRLGVPFDVTVHDYFAICPQVNLLRWPEGIYCGEPGPAGCNACIADLRSHGAKDIVSWRREKAWQFTEAQRVICPSADVKSRLARYDIGQNCIVVPHETINPGDWPVELPEDSDPPLRIVLLGVLASHKGARIVSAVAEAAAPGTIEIHLVGHLEASFPKPAVKLIKATGQYRDEDLDALLLGIKPHVFWFPSSAAEPIAIHSVPLSALDCQSWRQSY
jgi:GT2 family glycosyltransferase